MCRFLLVLLLISLLHTAALPSSAQDEPAPQNILTYIGAAAENGEDFNFLAAAIRNADPQIVDILTRDWNFTFFAPTDAAFTDTLESLDMNPDKMLGNPGLLTMILRYHLISGQYRAENFSATSGALYGTFVPGAFLTITSENNTITVNDATVTEDGIQVANGVIHVIDAVLLPPLELTTEAAMQATETPMPTATPVAPEETIAEMTNFEALQADENFSTLVALIESVEMDVTLTQGALYTVFAPTNDAFETALTALGVTVEDMMTNPSTVLPILSYHLIPGRQPSSDLRANAGASFATHQPGTTLEITLQDETLMIDQATLVSADLYTSNGVIHVIDNVLIP
jgi:transforming growth factor-beta-induced protein